MIPFLPEPLASLRSRYPAALAEPCDTESSRLGTSFRPGETRRCVFDCEDGLRLIISRDLHDGLELLHVSASINPGSRLWNTLRDGRSGPDEFASLAEGRFRDISGDNEPLDLALISPEKGIPHWFRDLKGITA
jgi:hypothetical protein